MRYAITVNRQAHTLDVAPDTPLLWVLRDELGLTGARFGCGHGVCGACAVLVDGQPLPSCTTKVSDVGTRSIVTIEGLAQGDELHPVQRAFLEEGALQCGYCTSGAILAASALVARRPSPTEDEIREALASHICRCGIYLRMIRAVQRAAR